MVKRDRFQVLQKKSSWLPRVVWAEESKTGLGFKIGPRQKMPVYAQLVTNAQSSRSWTKKELEFIP